MNSFLGAGGGGDGSGGGGGEGGGGGHATPVALVGEVPEGLKHRRGGSIEGTV